MARERSLKLIIRAEVEGAKRALEETAKASKKVGEEAEKGAKVASTASGRLVQSARENEQAWNRVGTTLTGFGVATLGALGASAKAAIDWESAWTGVVKTVDGSESELAALEDQLRQMARELPATHGEIAAVAEAAGQLGIATPNIAKFTETMIGLGEATDLSAEQAATAIAQMMNVMQTAPDDVDNLASTLVALGNAGASTESQILETAQRISGAGAMIGASEGEVLALAAAMSDLGINAQQGGGVMTRVLNLINTEVLSGGDNLAGFAKVAGMSAQQFADAWRESPMEALDAFIIGLGGIRDSGGDVVTTLSDLGIKGTQNTQVMQMLAGAGDRLTTALDLQKTAWSDNSALSEETQRRYETVAAKLAVLRNNVMDAAISFGEVFMPAIAVVSDGLAGVAGFVADLPGPLQATIGVLGALGGTAALAAGGFALMVPRVLNTIQAFRDLNITLPGIETRLGGLTRTVGGAATALGVLSAVGPQLQQFWMGQQMGANEAGQALLDYAAKGEEAESVSHELAYGFENLGTTLDRGLNRGMLKDIGEGFEELGTAFGVFGGTRLDQAQQWFKDVDAGIANLAQSGNGEKAIELFNQIATEAEKQGISLEQLKDAFPQAAAAIDAYIASAEGAAGPTGDLASVEEDLAAAADEARQAHADLANELAGLGGGLLGARAAARDYESAVLAAAEATGADGFSKTLDISTEAGQANQAMLDSIASSTYNYASAAYEAGAGTGEVASILADGRAAFIGAAEAFGMGSTEAAALADSLGLIPEDVEVMFRESGVEDVETAINSVRDYASSLEARIQLGADPTNGEDELLSFVTRTNTSTGTVDINGNPIPADSTLDGVVSDINSSEGIVDIKGDDAPGRYVLKDYEGAINASEGTVDILGNQLPGATSLRGLVTNIDTSSGTVDIKGNNSPGLVSVGGLIGYANKSSGSITINANTAAAYGKLAAVAAAVRSTVATMTIAARSGRAGGGPIFGPGTSTSDSIPATGPGGTAYALSNNEHVWTAAEVAAVGGHGAMLALRRAVLTGERRAEGGPVMPYGRAAESSGSVIAVLAAEDRALLQTLAERPVRLSVGQREFAMAVSESRTYMGRRGG